MFSQDFKCMFTAKNHQENDLPESGASEKEWTECLT